MHRIARQSWWAFAAGVLLAACAASPSAPTPGDTPTVAPTAQRSSRASPEADATAPAASEAEPEFTVQTYPVPPGSGPHDVAPADDGGIWYTAQGSGELGWLDPATGEVREVPLGPGSSPHGVIVGPDGAAWVTDGGLNAVVRVDPESHELTLFQLPPTAPGANLNTAAFDGDGVLWFTGQSGYYGSVDPASGEIAVYPAPRGAGPYGITATPDGEVYYSSLAGSYLGAIDRDSGAVQVVDPPTAGAGLRRAWADSMGRIWVSEWFAGQVGMYDPATLTWREWRLPGDAPQPYAVYVDEADAVWLTDFGANAIVRFDPDSETFTSFPADSQPAEVRQLLGRPGEVWGAESAADQLVVIRTQP
jgi:virginiamycin B lyase